MTPPNEQCPDCGGNVRLQFFGRYWPPTPWKQCDACGREFPSLWRPATPSIATNDTRPPDDAL